MKTKIIIFTSGMIIIVSAIIIFAKYHYDQNDVENEQINFPSSTPRLQPTLKPTKPYIGMSHTDFQSMCSLIGLGRLGGGDRTRSYETSSGVVVIISTTENLKRTNKECEEATFTFRNWELESIYR